MAFAIDVLFKFALTYGGAVLASLGLIINAGIEGVVDFVIVAVAASTLSFVYLMLGRRAVSSLQWPVLCAHVAAARPCLRRRSRDTRVASDFGVLRQDKVGLRLFVQMPSFGLRRERCRPNRRFLRRVRSW
jgi:hypothetical protein